MKYLPLSVMPSGLTGFDERRLRDVSGARIARRHGEVARPRRRRRRGTLNVCVPSVPENTAFGRKRSVPRPDSGEAAES